MSIKPPNKTYTKNNLEYTESFNDDGSLWMYQTTERTSEYKITSDYHNDNSLMYRVKTYYNQKGIPIKEEVWNYLEDEKGEYFERIIPVFPGYEDVSKMTEEDKKDLSKYIIIYQSLDDEKKESFLNKFKPHYNYGFNSSSIDFMEMGYTKVVAAAYNNLDVSQLVSLLHKDVVYESQNVMALIEGKENLINYLQKKFKVIKDSNNLVFAEIGYLDKEQENSCIILSQGSKENKGALILIQTIDTFITRIDICTVAPHWSSAIRTNKYPM
jgi:hypothetical protein